MELFLGSSKETPKNVRGTGTTYLSSGCAPYHSNEFRDPEYTTVPKHKHILHVPLLIKTST